MRERFMRFMQGRYGMDQLGNCLVWVTLIAFVINLFVDFAPLYWLAVILLIFSYSRMLSKNYARCSAQNRCFLDKTKGIRAYLAKMASRQAMRKYYHIYTCKNCKQKIRVPRGKGKIIVTCPKCKYEFMKKS